MGCSRRKSEVARVNIIAIRCRRSARCVETHGDTLRPPLPRGDRVEGRRTREHPIRRPEEEQTMSVPLKYVGAEDEEAAELRLLDQLQRIGYEVRRDSREARSWV